MGRIQSTRITSDTNVVLTADSPCVFNGFTLNILNAGSAVGSGAGFETLTFFEDNNEDSFTPTVDIVHGAKTFTINGGDVPSFLNRGLGPGDLITVTNAADSQNNTQFTIASITGTVITVAETMTHSETADEITITKNKVIKRFNWRVADFFATETFTNGILCREGLRVTCTNWTNLECFVLHS